MYAEGRRQNMTYGTEDGVETVRFSIDKHEYEIDLAPENAVRLREKFGAIRPGRA